MICPGLRHKMVLISSPWPLATRSAFRCLVCGQVIVNRPVYRHDSMAALTGPGTTPQYREVVYYASDGTFNGRRWVWERRWSRRPDGTWGAPWRVVPAGSCPRLAEVYDEAGSPPEPRSAQDVASELNELLAKNMSPEGAERTVLR